MLTGLVEAARRLTRPVITWVLVGTLCWIAVLFAKDSAPNAMEAVAIISPLAALAMNWWFESRRQQREREDREREIERAGGIL